MIDQPIDSYRHLKELFVAARALAGTRRVEFLESCGTDTALRGELERLLAADSEGGLGTIAPPARGATESAGVSVALPERVGDYVVTGLLGVGGMGVVYRARQKHPERDVAVKVLHPGLISHAVLRRFEDEVRALARLRHAGIATLIEAGMCDTEHGRLPFFAMELVEGAPLTRHAERANLSVRDRLGLFLRVCHAIEHAHQKGVIHRDLKPGNILVTGQGEVKILDFGVARLTDPDVQATALHTEAGALVGTIPYMSPEQVASDLGDIGTRSDVYALGVLLFELLTGSLPHDLRDKSMPEAVRMIRDEEPASLGAIDRAWRGDLDTIVAKAIAKEPTRRYGSAAALAADLERYLDDRPILARPASTLYQIHKFARRQKGLVAGILVAGVVLLGASVVSTTLAVLAIRERDRTQAEAEKLGAVNAFLTRMIQSPQPSYRIGAERKDEVRVVDVLDWAAENLATAYPDQPLVEATFRRTLGDTYWSLDRFEEWADQYDIALARQRSVLGNDHPDVLTTQLTIVDGVNSLGHYADAEALLHDACPRCERALGPNDALTIRCLTSLVSSLYEQRRWDEALTVCHLAMARSREVLSPDDWRYLGTRRMFTRLSSDRSEPEPALSALREIVVLAKSRYGDDNFRVPEARQWVAEGLLWAGRPAEAAEILRDTDGDWRRIGGAQFHMLACNEWLLGRALCDLGAFEEAERRLTNSVAITTSQQGEASPQTLRRRLSHAECVLRSGDVARAETHAREILDRCESGLARYQVARTEAQNLLGRILLARKWFDDAERYLALAVEGTRHWGERHPRAVEMRCDHARCRRRLDRQAESEGSLPDCHPTAEAPTP